MAFLSSSSQLPSVQRSVGKLLSDKSFSSTISLCTSSLSRELTCLEGIKRLEEWTKRMGLPTTLTEAKVDTSLIPKMTEKWDGGSHGGNFHLLSKKDIDAIFESAK